MGIDNFHSWLKTTYSTSFTIADISKSCLYEHVYIDLNFILHNCVYGCKTKDEFINRLNNKLNYILCRFIPTKSLTIAIDGVSPYAKLILQRRRRLAMSNSNSNKNENTFSSLHFTPGTEFMKELHSHVEKYIATYSKLFRYFKLKYYILPAYLPDEGEIKIIAQIKKNNNKKDKHLIIGNDADIIVIMMSLNIEKLFVLISNSKTKKYELLNLDNLYTLLLTDFPSNINIKYDFTLLSILMGNDYLPKLAFLNFNQLWNAYKKWYLVNNSKNLLLYTQEKGNTGIKFNAGAWKDFITYALLELLPKYRKIHLYQYKPHHTKSYLEGLLWCVNMYNTGKCSKYDYMYATEKIPEPMELLYFLELNFEPIEIPRSNTLALNRELYTLLVLPKKYKKLIPKKYHPLMDKQLKFLYEEEECKQCHILHAKLSELHMKSSALLKDDFDEEKEGDKEKNAKILKTIRKELGSFSSQMMKHKRTHDRFLTLDNINNIIKLCTAHPLN